VAKARTLPGIVILIGQISKITYRSQASRSSQYGVWIRKCLICFCLFQFIIIGSGIVLSAVSTVEPFIPNGFDEKHEYKTYSYDELAEHVKTAGINNFFVAEKIKLFAKLQSDNFINLKRTKFTLLSCHEPIYDRLE
jgi:hypothetical protein